jgi:hypothetical protein
MPQMGEAMSVGALHKIHVREGDALTPGSRTLVVRVDLSAGAPQDCPPVYCFQVFSRERVWVRRLMASVGEVRQVGNVLALFSTEPNEPIDGPVVRPLRVVCAAILEPDGWLKAG